MCFLTHDFTVVRLFIITAKKGENEVAETMGTKEASELWGYSQGTISKWCRQGLIPGARQDAPGSPWHIPKNAKCPKNIDRKRS